MYYIHKILNVYIYTIMVNILYAYYQYPQQSNWGVDRLGIIFLVSGV